MGRFIAGDTYQERVSLIAGYRSYVLGFQRI